MLLLLVKIVIAILEEVSVCLFRADIDFDDTIHVDDQKTATTQFTKPAYIFF